jgi:hypothetical protein
MTGQEVIGMVYGVAGAGFKAIAPYVGYIGMASFALMCLGLPFAGNGAAVEAKPAPKAE